MCSEMNSALFLIHVTLHVVLIQITAQITVAIHIATILATSNFRNDHTNLLWEAPKVCFEEGSSNVCMLQKLGDNIKIVKRKRVIFISGKQNWEPTTI